MSIAVQLYIIAGLEALVPVILLIILRRRHRYRFSSVVAGIASYFIAITILQGSFTTTLAYFGMDDAYWAEHGLAMQIVDIVTSVLFQNVVMYLIMRFALKTHFQLYDAIAVGIAYWFGDGFMMASSAVSYGRLAYLADKGRISEMVTKSIDEATLQGYYESLMQPHGLSSFYMQMLNLFVMIAVTVCLSILLYMLIKRKKAKYFFVALGVHALVLAVIELSQYFSNYNYVLYGVENLVVAAAAAVFLVRYMQWYHQLQAALIEKRKAYKLGLKRVVPVAEETEETSTGADEADPEETKLDQASGDTGESMDEAVDTVEGHVNEVPSSGGTDQEENKNERP